MLIESDGVFVFTYPWITIVTNISLQNHTFFGFVHKKLFFGGKEINYFPKKKKKTSLKICYTILHLNNNYILFQCKSCNGCVMYTYDLTNYTVTCTYV